MVSWSSPFLLALKNPSLCWNGPTPKPRQLNGDRRYNSKKGARQELYNFKECVCVCVSHPGQRVFPPPSLHFTPQAGDGDTCIASPSTKLAIHGEDISSGRGTDVPAFNTMTPLVHPAAVLCFHGSSCLHPPNRFLSAAEPPIVRRCAAFVQQSEGNYVKQFK